MKTDTYEELNNVLKNLCEERALLQSRIEENNMRIQETQSVNDKIQESEEEDFRIFSPRKNKNLYKDELNRANTVKEDCETENTQLFKEIERLNSIIGVMQNVIDETDQNQESDSGDCSFSHSDFHEELEHILHRIELSIKFMRQDPDRAGMELSAVCQSLRGLFIKR